MPIKRYRYPLPCMVITAVILPSETFSVHFVMLNIVELESTVIS